MKISIIIPTYNRAPLLYRTLYTLSRFSMCDTEIIVCVDDDEDYAEKTFAVCSQFPELSLITIQTGLYKRGRGWSVETYPYNVGIKQATGDLIMLNSSDVMSITNTLELHRLAAGENRVVFSTVHALTSDMTAKLDTYPWKTNPASILFSGSCDSMYCGRGISYTKLYPYEDAPNPYHFQMSVSRKILLEIGGFDEDFYGAMPAADDDLAHRLKQWGCHFVFLPEAVAVHQAHPHMDKQTPYGVAATNPNTGVDPKEFWAKDRKFKGVKRNTDREWGQFPRSVNDR